MEACNILDFIDCLKQLRQMVAMFVENWVDCSEILGVLSSKPPGRKQLREALAISNAASVSPQQTVRNSLFHTDICKMEEINISSERAQAEVGAALQEQLDKLDELVEKYLILLDQYQKARQELSEHLSSGFLDLAQANRSASAGRRFGEDYYDGRMQASRRISVEASDSRRLKFRMTASSVSESAPGESDEKEEQREQNVADPLRWFGILVPSALRSAQANFISAVEGPIPLIVNLTKELHGLEHEISRLKKSAKKLRPNLD